ncbi:MAG: 50S ribosomal protein L10 [Candidatus Anoxychlamydiales bacterium]|nr:50S ribosomal protein L10 [Candidatus Anoxychlamydiales bacterium]
MRDEKKLLLEEIEEKIERAKSLVITKYENINAKESWDFRSVLSKNLSEMEVVKKRIFLKAFENKGYSKIQELDGQIAIIFIKDDPINAIKAIFEFSQQSEK